MTGSEKQIKWAEDIKRDTIATLNGLVKRCERFDTVDSTMTFDCCKYTTADIRQVRDMVIAELEKITEARVMIDLRKNFSITNFETLARQLANGQTI